MIQDNHIIFKERLYINLSVNVLPVLTAEVLAYFEQLVLLDPLLACTLVVLLGLGPWEPSLALCMLAAIFAKREASVAIVIAVLDRVCISFMTHRHKLKQECQTDLSHRLSHIDLTFEALRIWYQIRKTMKLLERTDKHRIDIWDRHYIDLFKIQPQWKLGSKEYLILNYLHQLILSNNALIIQSYPRSFVKMVLEARGHRLVDTLNHLHFRSLQSMWFLKVLILVISSCFDASADYFFILRIISWQISQYAWVSCNLPVQEIQWIFLWLQKVEITVHLGLRKAVYFHW